MQKLLVTTAALLLSCPAFAQSSSTNQIGQACAQIGQTVMSAIQQEGIIACIPDVNGNLFWQPENGGVARYDATAACNVGGTLRWNGIGIQYCDGANWQSLGSSPSGTLCGMAWWDTQFHNVGIRVWCQGHQVLTGNGWGDCPSGYSTQLVGMEHDDAAQNHAFYSCVAN